MQVVFPPWVDLPAVFNGVRSFGAETFILDFTVKNKAATMQMSRQEAEALLEALKQAGVGQAKPALSIGSITLPKKGL
jgi:hypothetical protein